MNHVAKSELSPEARAIVEGRHSDPFHYLGPHLEDNNTVVRVFMPDASDVTVMTDAGESRLERVGHSAFFIGNTNAFHAIACGSASAIRMSRWKTRTGSRRCCPTSIFICSAKAIS